MYKMTRTFTDFNGVARTQDFYFNLTEAELLELEAGTEGTFTGTMEQIIQANNTPELLKHFKRLVLLAYGEKTPDGGFLKTDEIRTRFTSTQAYSDIFVELATVTESAIAFINGIVPANARKNMEQAAATPTIAPVTPVN